MVNRMLFMLASNDLLIARNSKRNHRSIKNQDNRATTKSLVGPLSDQFSRVRQQRRLVSAFQATIDGFDTKTVWGTTIEGHINEYEEQLPSRAASQETEPMLRALLRGRHDCLCDAIIWFALKRICHSFMVLESTVRRSWTLFFCIGGTAVALS